jgi:hypothetical protein
MLIKRGFLLSATLFTFGLVANVASASAEQWYFYAKNNSTTTMTSLLVSETGDNWGKFDIGSGIVVGENAKLVWSSSTNNESCNQYIKATFADGSESTPAKFNFCKDLDEPIVFQ